MPADVFDRVRTGVRDYEPARIEKERDAHSEGNRANGWAQSGSSSVDKKRERGRLPGPCRISGNSWETPRGGIGEEIGRSCCASRWVNENFRKTLGNTPRSVKFLRITPPLRGSRGAKSLPPRKRGAKPAGEPVGGGNRGTKGVSLPAFHPVCCWMFPPCAIGNRHDKVAVTRSQRRERYRCLRSPWIASAKSMNGAASWSPCFGTQTFTLPPANSV